MKRILVCVDEEAIAESLDLVEVADRLYGRDNREVWALFPWGRAAESRGVVDVIVRVAGGIAPYDIDSLTDCVEDLYREYRFDAILTPSTTAGRLIAPRVAMRLHAGLVAEVSDIRRENSEITLIRPAFSGRMLAAVSCRGEGPLMMSVGRNAFTREATASKETRTVIHAPRARGRSRIRLVGRTKRAGSDDIRESEVLVAGGGGVLRSFGSLEELARELGGMVAASRRIVDGGIAPRRIQVGQSGKSVSPRLYMALGISGSIQHVVGLKSAEHVIAVNTNRYAPICSLSDMVVEGDAPVFVEKLLERIRRGGSTRRESAPASGPTEINGGTK